MANLREIRDRIGSVKSTQQITRAMKLVAAAKLRKAQDKMVAFRPYSKKYDEFFTRLSQSDSASHPFFEENEKAEKVAVVVVSSDRGLCGAFNSNLFKDVESFISKNLSVEKENGNLVIIAVGRKSSDFFTRRNYNVIKKLPGLFDKLTYSAGVDLSSFVMSNFSKGEFRRVYVSFNEFKTILSQVRVIKQLLPVEKSDNVEVSNTDYIYEPSSAEILNEIAPEFVTVQMWRAILESNASEQGARMAAMDNATENAQELVKQLTLTYNQIRQAAITTEISEIVSGAEALSS